jgi:hypothetical protein
MVADLTAQRDRWQEVALQTQPAEGRTTGRWGKPGGRFLRLRPFERNLDGTNLSLK